MRNPFVEAALRAAEELVQPRQLYKIIGQFETTQRRNRDGTEVRQVVPIYSRIRYEHNKYAGKLVNTTQEQTRRQNHGA